MGVSIDWIPGQNPADCFCVVLNQRAVRPFSVGPTRFFFKLHQFSERRNSCASSGLCRDCKCSWNVRGARNFCLHSSAFSLFHVNEFRRKWSSNLRSTPLYQHTIWSTSSLLVYCIISFANLAMFGSQSESLDPAPMQKLVNCK
jgi:hypothetical protein